LATEDKTPLREAAPSAPGRTSKTPDRSKVARNRIIAGVVIAVVVIVAIFLLTRGNGHIPFVDNAELRAWAFATFKAQVLDMESAAIAHVAYSNEKPFIAFRSLSDLAGGDPGENQWATFVQLASGNSAAVVLAFLEALPAT